MEKTLGYSFDDEVANKFCYDIDNRKIEIHFAGYFDLLNNKYVESSCVWVIEDWDEAKGKLTLENQYDNLEKYLGVVSMVLSVEIEEDRLRITINTLDDRYVDLIFKNPKLRLV